MDLTPSSLKLRLRLSIKEKIINPGELGAYLLTDWAKIADRSDSVGSDTSSEDAEIQRERWGVAEVCVLGVGGRMRRSKLSSNGRTPCLHSSCLMTHIPSTHCLILLYFPSTLSQI